MSIILFVPWGYKRHFLSYVIILLVLCNKREILQSKKKHTLEIVIFIANLELQSTSVSIISLLILISVL